MKRIVANALLIVVGLVAVVSAHDKTPTPPDTRPAVELVTRFYDIRDLMQVIPDFTGPELVSSVDLNRGGGGGGGGGSLFSGSQIQVERSGPTRQEIGEQVEKLITDTVAPESWKDLGGSIGSIRENQGVLIVLQTPENQKRIEDYLTQYRKVLLPECVRIRAHWILTRRGELTPLLKAAGLHPASTPPAAPDDAANATALLEIDEAALNHIAGAVHFRGEILCMSGESVSMTATNSRQETIAPTPADPNANADSQLMVQTAGLILDTTNTLATDKKSMLLIVRSQWANTLPGVEKIPATRPASASAPTTAPATPSQPIPTIAPAESTSAMHDLHTTVRVPLGKTILIGGMTLDAMSNHTNSRKPGEEPAQLYLFIEATAQ